MASLASLLVRLERQIDSRNVEDMPSPEKPSCVLPRRHHCTSGWHWREDGGAGTAYERCPRFVAWRREAAAADVPGEQTFESFETIREPAAFQAVRLWVDACRGGAAKVALVRPVGLTQNTGCGKTHLLRAAVRELTRAGLWAELLSAPRLTAAVRGRALFDAAERSAAEIAVKRWTACEALILDDLGQEETAGSTTASFLIGLLEEREDRSLATASNLTEPELINRYGAPLVSRLLGGAHLPTLRGRDYRRQRREKE